jgi:hypothetical protein
MVTCDYPPFEAKRNDAEFSKHHVQVAIGRVNSIELVEQHNAFVCLNRTVSNPGGFTR